jgi:hypothetical protein
MVPEIGDLTGSLLEIPRGSEILVSREESPGTGSRDVAEVFHQGFRQDNGRCGMGWRYDEPVMPGPGTGRWRDEPGTILENKVVPFLIHDKGGGGDGKDHAGPGQAGRCCGVDAGCRADDPGAADACKVLCGNSRLSPDGKSSPGREGIMETAKKTRVVHKPFLGRKEPHGSAKAGTERLETPAFHCGHLEQLAGHGNYPVHVYIEPDKNFRKGRGDDAPIQIMPDRASFCRGDLFSFRTGEMISWDKKTFVPAFARR